MARTSKKTPFHEDDNVFIGNKDIWAETSEKWDDSYDCDYKSHNLQNTNNTINTNSELLSNSEAITFHHIQCSNTKTKENNTNEIIREYIARNKNNIEDTNKITERTLKSKLHEYLLAFESGRTLVVYSHKEYEINTYVVVDADRGEDLGRIISVIDSKEKEEKNNEEKDNEDSNTITNLKYLTSDVFDIQSHINLISDTMLEVINSIIYKYTNISTRNYFLTNYLFSEHKRILRNATNEEIKILHTERRQNEDNALAYLNHIKDLYCIDMEITKCEYQYDCKRITFYYKSTKRIDFRDLVKELFKHFKIRIWMCSENREFYR